MMANVSSGYGAGQRTTRFRRVFHCTLAMVFSIWLLFQINHQFENQRHRQKEENISIQNSSSLLLGRKVNLGSMAGGLVQYNEEHSYPRKNDADDGSDKTEKQPGEAKEGLIGEESVGFGLITEKTSNGEVQYGGAVTYDGNVFEDENGVPPNVSSVYMMKSEENGSQNASAVLGTL